MRVVTRPAAKEVGSAHAMNCLSLACKQMRVVFGHLDSATHSPPQSLVKFDPRIRIEPAMSMGGIPEGRRLKRQGAGSGEQRERLRAES